MGADVASDCQRASVGDHLLMPDTLIRARDLRKFKVTTVVLYVVTAALAIWTLAIASNVRNVVSQIQHERERNTLTSCKRSNEQNAAIVGFVTATIPQAQRNDPLAQAYLTRAAKTFPQRDCAAEVRRTVRGAKP